jgi:hypothetical protein
MSSPVNPRAARLRVAARNLQAWAEWQLQLGPRLKDRGYPTLTARTLGTTTEPTTLGGYSVVRAMNLDAAVELAGGCPHLLDGGAVEVAELVNNDEVLDDGLECLGPADLVIDGRHGPSLDEDRCRTMSGA